MSRTPPSIVMDAGSGTTSTAASKLTVPFAPLVKSMVEVSVRAVSVAPMPPLELPENGEAWKTREPTGFDVPNFTVSEKTPKETVSAPTLFVLTVPPTLSVACCPIVLKSNPSSLNHIEMGSTCPPVTLTELRSKNGVLPSIPVVTLMVQLPTAPENVTQSATAHESPTAPSRISTKVAPLLNFSSAVANAEGAYVAAKKVAKITTFFMIVNSPPLTGCVRLLFDSLPDTHP